MKAMRNTITTFDMGKKDGNKWRVDVVETKDEFEAWIYTESYGTKSFMYGVPKNQSSGINVSREMFLSGVEESWETYIDMYMTDVNAIDDRYVEEIENK